MRVLFIDTSSQIASVSAFEDESLLGEFTVLAKRTHSQRLMPMVDAFLKQLELKTEDFDAFGVCVGPGSFTGVRIGISTIKAFAQVHQKPVFTLTSLAMIAGKYAYHQGTLAVVMKANKDEWFYGFYACDQGNLSILCEGVDAPHEVLTLSEKYPSILWVGDVALTDFEALKVSRLERPFQTSASALVWLKTLEPKSHYTEVVAEYFKKSQAERDFKI